MLKKFPKNYRIRKILNLNTFKLSHSSMANFQSLITFNKAKVIYELALKDSGYKREMIFDRQPSARRNRNGKIIWFNPAFVQNVKINTANSFFKLVQKNFQKNHKFRKIFSLKLSYSSVPNSLATELNGYGV